MHRLRLQNATLPRKNFAKVIDHLSDAGARAIAFDFLFLGKSNLLFHLSYFEFAYKLFKIQKKTAKTEGIGGKLFL